MNHTNLQKQNNIVSFISASGNIDGKQFRKPTAVQVTMSTTELPAFFNCILYNREGKRSYNYNNELSENVCYTYQLDH
jgi:hypothetical protein